MSAPQYAVLALAADTLDDLEKARIAAKNRLQHMTRDEVDADGGVRDLGLGPNVPEVLALRALVDGIDGPEHQAMLALRRSLRNHPLGPWVKQARGVGEKQGARLLAAIGDPYWNTLHDRPRTVSELWAFCGYHVLPVGQSKIDAQMTSADGSNLRTDHILTEAQTFGVGAAQLPGGGDVHQQFGAQTAPGVAPSRAKGQRQNWSDTARMRAYLVAESCMKQPADAPYRMVYDAARAKYAEAIHAVECRRCGPKGKPALPGSDLSDGHKHARALRAVAKEVSRDLWRESRRLHGEGQSVPVSMLEARREAA